MIERMRVLVLLSLGACASGPAEYLLRPSKPVGWPPSAPRVEFQFAYEGTSSSRRHPGFWESLANLFTGGQDVRLVSPNGMAMVGDDLLMVADPGQRVIHRLTIGTGDHVVMRGTEDCPLLSPVGIAVVPDGRAFVTDSSLGHVVEFAADGTLLRPIGNPSTLGRPTGICFDATRGRLLITDTTGCRIVAMGTDGQIQGTYGKRGVELGEFNYPTNITVSASGSVLVVDTMNFRVVVLDPDLKALRSFGLVGRGPGTFASPKGIATDSQGHVYVVDAMFDNIQVFDPDGRLLLVFASRGTALGSLYLPSGILIDANDRIVVADSGNSRIQFYQFHRLAP